MTLEGRTYGEETRVRCRWNRQGRSGKRICTTSWFGNCGAWGSLMGWEQLWVLPSCLFAEIKPVSISWRHAILDFLSTVIMKREIQDDRKRGAVWDVSHSAGRSDLQKQEWTKNNKVDFFFVLYCTSFREEKQRHKALLALPSWRNRKIEQ